MQQTACQSILEMSFVITDTNLKFSILCSLKFRFLIVKTNIKMTSYNSSLMVTLVAVM